MPKISQLPELNEQLVNGDRAIVVHAGDTMQWDPYDYLVKNSGDETVAGVKTFSSSPVVPDADAANEAINKRQLDAVQNLATPLSDLSRAMQINGDGVPTFPDNVAGRVYWKDDFSTTDSWSGINGTVSVSGGVLIGTATGTPFGVSRVVSGSANNVIRIKVKASISILLQIQLSISGVDTLVKTQQLSANQYSIVDFIAPSNFTRIILYYSGASTGNTLSIDTIYIGSGLYDTPVYDKACCNRFTNYGALPVNGLRGKALQFSGAQYLQADNPVIGTTGTVAIKFKCGVLGTTPVLVDNRDTSKSNGFAIVLLADNTVNVIIRDATQAPFYSLGTISDIISIHTLVIAYNGTTIVSYLDNVMSSRTQTVAMSNSTTNLCIGRPSSVLDNFFTGNLYDFRYDSRIWTADDVTRYHNGDDTVDSQQKAVTPTPRS